MFEFEADRNYFEALLCEDRESINDFKNLFDFRPVDKKRSEFNQERNKLLVQLLSSHGRNCMLQFPMCDISSGINIDHLIPLATNKLNKELRNLVAEPGQKVRSQSFGSNHLDNLIIACANCNNHKKHRIIEREKLMSILRIKMDAKG